MKTRAALVFSAVCLASGLGSSLSAHAEDGGTCKVIEAALREDFASSGMAARKQWESDASFTSPIRSAGEEILKRAEANRALFKAYLDGGYTDSDGIESRLKSLVTSMQQPGQYSMTDCGPGDWTMAGNVDTAIRNCERRDGKIGTGLNVNTSFPFIHYNSGMTFVAWRFPVKDRGIRLVRNETKTGASRFEVEICRSESATEHQERRMCHRLNLSHFAGLAGISTEDILIANGKPASVPGNADEYVKAHLRCQEETLVRVPATQAQTSATKKILKDAGGAAGSGAAGSGKAPGAHKASN
jgi:hypothetical protein